MWQQLDEGAYFPAGTPLPPALAAVREGGEGQQAAAHALGGCLSHLRDVLLDKQVLAAGRVEPLADSFGIGAGLAASSGGAGAAGSDAGPVYMALDGAALENLEVSERAEWVVQASAVLLCGHVFDVHGGRHPHPARPIPLPCPLPPLHRCWRTPRAACRAPCWLP